MKIKNIIKKIICLSLAVGIAEAVMGTGYPNTYAEESDEKLIALTFDDGPNTTTTNDVLDVLEEYDAVASFFLIGDKIDENSAAAVKRAYDMGCEIDSHSKTHSRMSAMTSEEIVEEIEYVDNMVYNIIGEYTKFFRPPYIDTSQIMYDAIDKPFICGVGCGDSSADTTALERADSVISSAKDGQIILMHDFAGNSRTVEALKIIIPALKLEGYEFVTLTELFDRQGETPDETQLYSRVAKYPCKDYTLYKNIFNGEVTGDPKANEWKTAALLDTDELTRLGDTFAVEVMYKGTYQPVIALQKWTGESIFISVQPRYYNGKKACFLASDIKSALNDNNLTFEELDRISIIPYGGIMTMTNVDLLVQKSTDSTILGDVDNSGKADALDAILLQKWLLNVPNTKLENWEAGDLCKDGKLNIFDFCVLKNLLIK